MPRSKTTEVFPEYNTNGKLIYQSNDIEMVDLGGFKSNKKYSPYKQQHDLLSEARVSGTTVQTEGNLVAQTDRPTPSKSSRSSIFGSIHLHTLRSARQLLPKSFRGLRQGHDL
jgi:hypothetical protein